MYHRLRRWPRLVLCLVVIGLVCVTGVWLRSSSSRSVASQPTIAPLASQAFGQPGEPFGPATVVGQFQCVDCHRSEYVRWSNSKHATRAFDLLRVTESSREYAEAMGIEPAEIAKSSICVQCHATPQHDANGRPHVIAGISCEACHNPAGGEQGWLNRHAVYGPTGTRRDEEARQHRQERFEFCNRAGQLRSSDTYELAKRCFECHIVGNEKLVNEAEHPSASRGFEFAEKSLGEVRHNFHLNQQVNAEVSTLWTDPMWQGAGRTAAGRKRLMFVVGALVDLELSLRNLARATDEDGDYFEEMAERVIDAYELLEDDILGEVEVELPLVEQALEAVEELYEKIDDEEFSLGEDKPACLAAAEAVSRAAREFARTHDGSKLSDLEEPETPQDE